MAAKVEERKKPSKPFMAFVIILYNLANLVVLISILLHLPFIIDTVDFGSVQHIVDYVRKIYYHFNLIASFVELICILSIYAVWGTRGFPSTLSLIASLYNFIVCTGFALLMYITDMREIYAYFQIIFLIPIITIFLSSVFLIDDFFDLLRGKFKFENRTEEKKKKVKGELKAAENPNKDVIVSPAESIHLQQNVISSAAEKAVPSIGKKK